MKKKYIILSQHNDWWNAIQIAMRLKILFPDRVAELELNSVWESMKEEYRSKYGIQNNLPGIGLLAAYLKILFPDRVAELELNSVWESMKENLHKKKTLSWWEAAANAANLKIIAAKKVKITEQGIELEMENKEEFKDETPPRPTRLAS